MTALTTRLLATAACLALGLTWQTALAQTQESEPQTNGTLPEPLQAQPLENPQSQIPQPTQQPGQPGAGSFEAPAPVAPPRTLAPRQLTVPQPQQPATVPLSSEPPANVGPAIQIDRLGTLQPDSAGPLNQSNGGFGGNAWQGLSRPVADSLFARLPDTYPSATMRNIIRGLMLTSATPPVGAARAGSFVALRAEKLLGMGDVSDVVELINVTPQSGANPVLTRLEAEAQFLNGQHAEACASAAGNIQSGGTFWQKALIFCQALAGQFDQANLGLSLLREVDAGDTLFPALIARMAEGGGGLEEVALPPSPLHIAMAKHAKTALTGDGAGSVFDPVLALETATSPDDRLASAIAAENLGLITVQQARQLFSGVTFLDEHLADPLAQLEKMQTPTALALLYQAALLQRDLPIVQTELIDAAVRLAKDAGLMMPTARIFKPLADTIQVSSDLLWFAPTAMRLKLGASDFQGATRWYSLLRNASIGDPTALGLLRDVQALGWIAGLVVDERLTVSAFRDWRATRLPEDDPAAQGALMLALLDGTGGFIQPEIWTELIADPALEGANLPGLAVWRKLADAGQKQELGKALLLMAIGLGDKPVAATHPLFLNAVLSTLRGLGLERDARRLAVEVALAARL